MDSEYTQIIAIQECSAGNETIGDMWLETKSFDNKIPIEEIIDWADGLSNAGGRLIITVDHANKKALKEIPPLGDK